MRGEDTEGQKLLIVKDLKTYFYTFDGISKTVGGVGFEVEKGEILGIVGEPGSGKSVTSNSIIHSLPARIRKIVGGSIDFNGTDTLRLSQRELLEFRGRDISMILQDPMTPLSPVFRVRSQMVETIYAHQKVAKAEARNMAEGALKRVGIPDARRRMEVYPYEPSGSTCQGVIIVVSVCSKSQMIIADELTTTLDVTIQAQVLNLLGELCNKHGTAILPITYNLGVIRDIYGNVIVMYADKTVEYAPCIDLYNHPFHPYTWGLLDRMPRLSNSSKEELSTTAGTSPDLGPTEAGCNSTNRCLYAQEQYRTEMPELIEISPDHRVVYHWQTGGSRPVRNEVTESGKQENGVED